MKKFAFRLEPVLKLRQYKERQAQMELARAQAVLKENQLQLETTQNEAVGARSRWEAGLEKGMWETEFRMHADHLRGVKQQIHEILERKMQLEELVAMRQKELMDATVERKSMDLLKEKQMKEHQAEAGKAEQKQTDELAVLHRSSQERLNP